MTHSAEKDALLSVIATAIADHYDGYDPGDLPTEFHGYAQAVTTALDRAGYRVIPPAATDHGVYFCDCRTDAHERPHAHVIPPAKPS